MALGLASGFGVVEVEHWLNAGPNGYQFLSNSEYHGTRPAVRLWGLISMVKRETTQTVG